MEHGWIHSKAVGTPAVDATSATHGTKGVKMIHENLRGWDWIKDKRLVAPKLVRESK